MPLDSLATAEAKRASNDMQHLKLRNMEIKSAKLKNNNNKML